MTRGEPCFPPAALCGSRGQRSRAIGRAPRAGGDGHDSDGMPGAGSADSPVPAPATQASHGHRRPRAGRNWRAAPRKRPGREDRGGQGMTAHVGRAQGSATPIARHRAPGDAGGHPWRPATGLADHACGLLPSARAGGTVGGGPGAAGMRASSQGARRARRARAGKMQPGYGPDPAWPARQAAARRGQRRRCLAGSGGDLLGGTG